MDPLVEAIIARAQRDYQNNPYIGIGNQLRSTPVTSPNYSLGQNLLIGALAGAGGGALSGFGEAQYKNELTQNLGNFSSALGSEDPVSALRADPNLSEYAPYYQLQEQSRLKGIEDAIIEKSVDQQLKSPFLTSRLSVPSVKAKKGTGGGIEVDIKNQASLTPLASGTSDQQKKEVDIFGDIPSLSDKYQAELQKNLYQTGSATVARQAANAITATDIKASQDDLAAAREARNKAKALKESGKTISSLADQVGYTGLGGGAIKTIKSALIPLEKTAGIDLGLEREVTNAQVLETTIPSSLALAREGLPGQVSNYENQIYSKAAAGLDKTPEFNKLVGQLFVEKSKQAEEYSNFISAYYQKKGHTIGANEIWDKFTEQHPLVDLDPKTGKFIINTNRPSWREGLRNLSTKGEGEEIKPPQGKSPLSPSEKAELQRLRVKYGR